MNCQISSIQLHAVEQLISWRRAELSAMLAKPRDCDAETTELLTNTVAQINGDLDELSAAVTRSLVPVDELTTLQAALQPAIASCEAAFVLDPLVGGRSTQQQRFRYDVYATAVTLREHLGRARD